VAKKRRAKKAKKPAGLHWPLKKEPAMDDESKAQKPHQDLGEVGEAGDTGHLGSNAAGADRTAPAAQESTSGFRLVPRQQGPATEVSAEEQLSAALLRVGFSADESQNMAKSAVEEIARRAGDKGQ
jgi:hypothetical protein